MLQDYLESKGVEDFEVTLAVPSPQVFTKKEVSRGLEKLAEKRGISLVPEYHLEKVEGERVVDIHGKALRYDLLAIVPPHRGPRAIESLGGEMGYIPTHRHKLKALGHSDIYVVGDVASLPTSKAASSTHLQAEVVANNLTREIYGKEPLGDYHGRAICYLVTSLKEAMVIELDYGGMVKKERFPLPLLGPLSLGRVTRLNYMGKLFSRWLYWHSWLRGGSFPLTG